MRGYFKTEVERLLTSKTVVILDTLNYIKGFRYELYCLARTAKSTNCVVNRK
jgi:protein KTI12